MGRARSSNATTTVEAWRGAYICNECLSALDRLGQCEDHPEHTGTVWADDGACVEVEVSGLFSPYIPARLSGPPEDCYPAEGGECEDFTATVDGKEFPLASDEEDYAIEKLAGLATEDDGYDGPEYEPDDFYDPY
jgi:hypothetical protein